MNGEQKWIGKEEVFCVCVCACETPKKSTKSSIITGDLIFEKRTLNLPTVSTNANKTSESFRLP